MKRLKVLFLVISLIGLFGFLSNSNIVFAQTSRYTLVIRDASGNPQAGLNVDLYHAGGAKAYDLTESGTNPGQYSNSAVVYGQYDLYVGGIVKRTNIWIGAEFIGTVITLNFNSSGEISTDTAYVKDMKTDTVSADIAYIKFADMDTVTIDTIYAKSAKIDTATIDTAYIKFVAVDTIIIDTTYINLAEIDSSSHNLIMIIDPTDADTTWVYDDGDTTRIVSNNNPIKIGDGSLVVKTNGDVLVENNFIVNGFNKKSTSTGITAMNAGVQGDEPLTADINEISTVVTAGDAVTLPSAESGMEIFIINNDVNQLKIWPASGDDAGAGVDTSVTLASGSTVTYVAYNNTNWKIK